MSAARWKNPPVDEFGQALLSETRYYCPVMDSQTNPILPFPDWHTADIEADNGLFNARNIRALIESGAISAEREIEKSQLQPASLDLRLGRRGFRLRASFLPGPKAQVEQKARALSLHEFSLESGMVLEAGCTYLIEIAETLSLPKNITAFASPKSSTGRIDVFTRLISDYGIYFDQLRAGYKGRLWLEISPRSFGIIVRPNSRLTQLRFRKGRAAYDNYRLGRLHKEQTLIVQEKRPQQKSWQNDAQALHLNQGLLLSVDLSPQMQDGICGFRARHHTPLIDVDQNAACVIDHFWESIPAPAHGQMILDPDAFYILSSREAVRIPSSHAAEMVAFDAQIGEFRAHYAGFFDPGFGVGGAGAKAVLEIRSRETAFTLEHGQIIGRLVFERLTYPADEHYDHRAHAHYQGQGLALSKHFRVP